MNRKIIYLVFAAIVIYVNPTLAQSPYDDSSGVGLRPAEPVKTLTAKNGAVVSAHYLASEVGVTVMKNGGNAIDAAIATQLALAVVYPSAGNIGGGGFLVAVLSDGRRLALDYRESAPRAAYRNMYLDKDSNVLANKSLRGPSSSGVPGTVAGIFASLAYAKLPFKMLIAPAIRLAEEGFVIDAAEANSLNHLQPEFARFNAVPSAFQRQQTWKAGDTLVQKDLAQTLRRIERNGRNGFYKGRTAKLIVREMKRGGGFIGRKDLKNYQAIWRRPHEFAFRNYRILSMPLPSSGGILLHQMLKMIEGQPLSSYGVLAPSSVQLMTEVERRAFADRAKWMGDPDFYDVPVNVITSEDYLRSRMQNYRPDTANGSVLVQPGKVADRESEETTHISIVDAEGNAVAVTTTLNDSYGSRTVVGHAGFLLNDEMDDFSIKPGVANMYGAVGGEANAIAPGKRMLSSMTPTIVLKENKPFLVVGTPGGTTIPTSVFQTIVNILEFNLGTREAVDIPKFHHQWLPDRLDVEKKFPLSLRLSLEQMGYNIYERGTIGRTEVIKILPDGTLECIADKRGQDSAAGY